MNRSPSPLPKRRRLGPHLEFLLRMRAIGRTPWYGKLALLLVTGGLAIIQTDWIGILVSSAWQVIFGESIALSDPPPWYGLLLVIAGIVLGVWCVLKYERPPTGDEAPDLDRPSVLEQLEHESLARCTSRLTASMAFRDRIPDLVAAFDELPDLAATAVIPSSGGVSVLTGPLGSGKSFAADRLFRAAVERAGDPDARLPVYINARHVTADLKAYCTRAVSQLGDPSVLGAAIIVDQLDDLPATDAQRLYEEADLLARSWPNTGVLLVARSVQWLPFPDASAVTIREMTLDEAERLVDMVSGQAGHPLWTLPEAVRRSAQRPLIAILLASYIASRPGSAPSSVGRLVEWMVRQATNRRGANVSQTVEARLRALAVRLTDGARAVPAHVLTSSVGVLGELTSTQLVSLSPDGLDFALPILRQWFAFAALMEGEISVEDVAGDPARLDRWTDVIATAVELAPDEAALDHLLVPIARSSPAVASLVLEALDEGVEEAVRDGEVGSVPAEGIGTQLRQAMSAFLDGLGPIGREIGPVRETGQLKPLGIGRADGQFLTAWYEGAAPVPDVVDLSDRGDPGVSWSAWQMRSERLPRAWAWRYAKTELSRELEHRLKDFDLPVNNAVFVHELAWWLVTLVLNRQSPFESEVTIEDLEAVLRSPWHVPVHARCQLSARAWPLVNSWLRSLVRRGTPLRAPWPGPDQNVSRGQTGFSRWDLYSPETQRKRLANVLTAALGIYSETITTWFPKMGAKCERFTQMPARLVAYLDLKTQGRPPSYAYYLESLPGNQTSHAVVHLHGIDHIALFERAREATPTGPVRVYSSVMDVFGRRPATGTALHWLSQELSELRWVSTFVVPE